MKCSNKLKLCAPKTARTQSPIPLAESLSKQIEDILKPKITVKNFKYLMESITFKKSKLKYFIICFLLLLIIIGTLYIGFQFISNPTKYIFWMLPTETSVFSLGIIGILASLVLIYILIKTLLNKNFNIKIDKNGLFLGLIQHSKKLVLWNDITKIESIKIDGTKYIIIYVRNVEYYGENEKGIQKHFFNSKTNKYKTPFVININSLSENFDTILNSIITNWKKYKE